MSQNGQAVRDDDRTLKRAVSASLIGTTIEWYDFFLYGAAAALVFNRLFFPKFDPLTGTLLAFGTYALGFVARPLGGVIFGHFGDRVGRKKLLMISLMMMGISTCLIGVLPTYDQVGTLAPLLLVGLRLVQGVAVGGEWGGAVLLIAERGAPEHRGFWASWAQVGVPAGNLLAAAVLAVLASTLSQTAFEAWGWRLPFLLSIGLVSIGWWLRMSLEESQVFTDAVKETPAKAVSRSPVLQVLRERPGGILIGGGLRFGENISYYVITAFSITYLVEVQGGSRAMALNALLFGAAAECVAVPLFAALSDRFGRRPVYAIGAFGMAVWIFGFFLMLNQAQFVWVTAAMVGGLILHGAMYGPQAAFMSELFPTRMRYSGVSLAYQVTSIFAGSLAPIIALALYQHFDTFVPVAVYVGATCLISGLSALIARETKGQSLSA